MAHRDRHGLTGAAYDSGGGTLDRPASAPATPATRRRGRARLRQTRLAGGITTTAGVGGGAGGGSALDAGRIAGLRRQKLATQRAASEAAVRARSAAASASLFGESAQSTADAALAAYTPARGWLRDSSRQPVKFQSRSLRRLRKQQRQQLARHYAASEEGMQTLRTERVDFLAQRQDFAHLGAPVHRHARAVVVPRAQRFCAARAGARAQGRSCGARSFVARGGAQGSWAKRASQARTRGRSARKRLTVWWQCKYATREGITKSKGVIYAGATGSCSCFKPRPATAAPVWSSSRDDAYEESLPIATLLERELGERAGTAASILEYQYRTVGELRRGWPSAARLLSRHVCDGRELCQQLVASFDSLPLDKFLANAAWDLDWQSAHTVLKCRYSTAGSCAVGGTDCVRLYVEWEETAMRWCSDLKQAGCCVSTPRLRAMNAAGGCTSNREGGGVGTGDAELAEETTRDVNRDHHSHSHKGSGIAMRRRRNNKNNNKMAQSSSHSLRPMSASAAPVPG